VFIVHPFGNSEDTRELVEIVQREGREEFPEEQLYFAKLHLYIATLRMKAFGRTKRTSRFRSMGADQRHRSEKTRCKKKRRCTRASSGGGGGGI
jgi:hypothetical protein